MRKGRGTRRQRQGRRAGCGAPAALRLPQTARPEKPRKPRPWSSAPAPRRGGQGGLGLQRSENRGASPRPELDPAATSGATSGPPPEAGSAGAAALTLHPSRSPGFFASFVSSRQSGFWCWCPAAVSGVRPPRATRLGPPRCSAPPTARCRQTPATVPAGGRAGRRGAGAAGPVGGAGRVGEEVRPRPAQAWTSREREAGADGTGLGNRPAGRVGLSPALRHPTASHTWRLGGRSPAPRRPGRWVWVSASPTGLDALGAQGSAGAWFLPGAPSWYRLNVTISVGVVTLRSTLHLVKIYFIRAD